MLSPSLLSPSCCRRLARVAAAAMLFVLCGCAAATRPAPPEIDLVDVRLGELTLSHAHLLADLRVFNPNSVPIIVRRVTYDFLLNGVRTATGRSLEKAAIGAGETGTVTLRISAAYFDLWRFTAGREPEEAISYALEGAMDIGGFRVLDSIFPFRREGVLDLRRLPLLRGQN